MRVGVAMGMSLLHSGAKVDGRRGRRGSADVGDGRGRDDDRGRLYLRTVVGCGVSLTGGFAGLMSHGVGWSVGVVVGWECMLLTRSKW